MPLFEVVIANREDIARVVEAPVPSELFPGIFSKGIDHVKLAMLSQILGSTTYDEALAALDPVNEESEEGPWVSVLPASMVLAVANLGSSDVENVVSRWAALEEFQADLWSLDDVKNYFGSFRELAKRAKAENKLMMLWFSL